MAYRNSLRLDGHVRLVLRHRDGSEKVIALHNLVVNKGLQSLAAAFRYWGSGGEVGTSTSDGGTTTSSYTTTPSSGGTTTVFYGDGDANFNYPVVYFGTGTTTVRASNDMSSIVNRKQATTLTTSYSSNSVFISFLLDYDDAVGVTLREVALGHMATYAGEVLFSRLLLGDNYIAKTSDFQVYGEWILSVSAGDGEADYLG